MRYTILISIVHEFVKYKGDTEVWVAYSAVVQRACSSSISRWVTVA